MLWLVQPAYDRRPLAWPEPKRLDLEACQWLSTLSPPLSLLSHILSAYAVHILSLLCVNAQDLTLLFFCSIHVYLRR